MNWNLATPHSEGLAARQAHADIPENSFEREIGREGFSGAAAHMYHRNPPTAWSNVEGPIRPRAFNAAGVATVTDSPWQALGILGNAHVQVRFWRTAQSMDHLVRNSDGDDLLFVHRGAGEFFCDYGHLSFTAGDYILLPRGTMWRMQISEPVELLMIEATGSNYRLPDRGLLGRHSLFDPGVLDRPALDAAFRDQPRNGTWRVEVKRRGRIGRITYPFNPLDAMGWKGDLHPVRLNVHDIRAVASPRLHLPPSARTTFVADRFVVCTLTPRPIETDPGAIKLPFFHNNDDYDEVIFYHRGEMGSGGGVIGEGMFTYHPSGITHGPHPGVLPYMHQHPAKSFENYSVMLDVLDGLDIGTLPAGGEIADYAELARFHRPRARRHHPGVTPCHEARHLAGRHPRRHAAGGQQRSRTRRARRRHRAHAAGGIGFLDGIAPRLAERAAALRAGWLADAFALDIAALAAPLPRSYGWIDSSVYLNHMELARGLRGVPVPDAYRREPLMSIRMSAPFLSARGDLVLPDEDVGLDIEAEVAVIVDDIAYATSAAEAARRIRLITLVSDTSRRTVFAREVKEGKTTYHGKSVAAMAPVVATPDELGAAWDGHKVTLPLICHVNARLLGRPNAGVDMSFGFPELVAHASSSRPLPAGTLIAAGTVSNRDRAAGSACIAERRMIETLEHGAPRTEYLHRGDHIRIEMLGTDGQSVFGAIAQNVV